MKLRVPTKLAKEILDTTKDAYLAKSIDESSLKRYVDFDGLLLSDVSVKAFHKALKETTSDLSNDFAFLYAALRGKLNLKIQNMSQVRTCVISYLKHELDKGFLFRRGEYESVLPVLVTDVVQTESSSRYSNSSAKTTVDLSFVFSTTKGNLKEGSLHISPRSVQAAADAYGIDVTLVERNYKNGRETYTDVVDFKVAGDGVPVELIFKYHGLFKETPALHELYIKQVDRFFKFLPQFGKQFKVRGYATSGGWFSQDVSMLTEGKPGRCILDTIPAAAMSSEETNSRPRRIKPSYFGRDDDDNISTDVLSKDSLDIPLEELTQADLQLSTPVRWLTEGGEPIRRDAPLHPTVQIFHLEKYRSFSVHVNNITPYKYRDGIIDSLVLPSEIKQLALMLVGDSSLEEIDDVIEGKSQSTLITLIGDPGVGKTLLAEVIAEVTEKPLYKIPADRLGGSADVIEINLKKFLRQAETWNAVLMIDEANAYVHARGTNVEQNAIVGVFLRLVEYFKGTLILTTNQTSDNDTFDIDDAVLSRSDAVIRIELPTPEDAKRIWLVQARHLKISLDEALIDKLVSTYTISGRSIRKLLLNSVRWAAYNKEDLSFKHFKACAKYIPSTNAERSSLKKS